jgi:hypothetical protein
MLKCTTVDLSLAPPLCVDHGATPRDQRRRSRQPSLFRGALSEEAPTDHRAFAVASPFAVGMI